jgi:hypothetical protein
MQRKWRETTHVIVEDVKKNNISLIKNRDKGDTFEDYYTLRNLSHSNLDDKVVFKGCVF